MSTPEPWNCPGCNAAVTTRFCPACGERALPAHELTLRGLAHQVLEALTNIDSRLIRSLRCLVNRPGSLTVAYLQGRRQYYIKPFQLFLIANALFFAVQSMTDARIFSTSLDSHLHGQDWSDLAQSWVTQRLESLPTTLERLAPVFDQAVALNAKSLIILMALPFSLLLPVVFRSSRRPFAAHVAFSLHFYSFLLLLFCAALAIAAVDVLFGGSGLKSSAMDNILSLLNIAACATYLFFATGTVYGERGGWRIFKTAALTAAVAGIVLGYRFVLLPITLYTTSV